MAEEEEATSPKRTPTIDDLGIGLDDLIRLVDDSDPGAEPTDLVAIAMAVGDRLGELGDHLVGHFVDQARAAGASWREIGASMGVTKQAAQKRFVPGRGDPSEEGLFQRFTVRARRVVEVAHEEARRMRSAAVSPEHLLVGLVTDPEGLSAKALASQGITPDHVRGAVAASGLATVDEVGDRVPFGSDTKKILGFGLREALRRRHNYIGTEHLLLGAMTDDTMGSARILTRLGADLDTTREWIDRFLGDLVEEKTGFRPELAD